MHLGVPNLPISKQGGGSGKSVGVLVQSMQAGLARRRGLGRQHGDQRALAERPDGRWGKSAGSGDTDHQGRDRRKHEPSVANRTATREPTTSQGRMAPVCKDNDGPFKGPAPERGGAMRGSIGSETGNG